MKYCSRCGSELVDDAVVCTHCGCLCDKANRIAQDRYNGLAIGGFVASFFSNIVGLILCIIALNQLKKSDEKGKGLAQAGLVISIVSLCLTVFFVVGYLVFIIYFFIPAMHWM